MIEFCSCLNCGFGMESIVLDGGNHSQRILTHSSSRSSCCFNPQFPVRTGRTFKGLCFLTASLTFCIGIGVGVLIPLYFLPITAESPITFQRTFSSVIGGESYEISSSTNQTPQSVINQQATTSERTTFNFPQQHQENSFLEENSKSVISGNSNNYENVAFNSANSNSNSSPPPPLLSPIFRRPNPSVQFVSSDSSRILSLSPIQPEIPSLSDSVNINNINSNNNNNKNKSRSEHKAAKTGSFELLNGIYWSKKVERSLPRGFTDEETKSWRRFVNKSGVEKIEEGCGRMQNRLLTLDNGTLACCRYRQNFDQIQGEIFSFYLSQLLGLHNLAPSSLGLIQPLDRKWASVQSQLNLAQWAEEKPVVLTRFIPNLTPAYIPSSFRDPNRRLHPIDVLLSSNSVEIPDFIELAQWSDLIVFDYLTANLDRMVNNLYNLQWNPSMMEAPAHNLAKEVSTGLLVFLDNESGLLHGYRLLEKYEHYHRLMLDSLCVFRQSTAEAVKRLHRDKNVGLLLKTMFKSSEPSLLDYLPMIPDKSIKILNHRIDRVYDQIIKCESLYMNNSS